MSKVLGAIELDGGIGGGSMEGTVDLHGDQLRVRLEIDHPGRLDQALIDQVDLVLERPELPDRIARDAISARVERAGSAPAALLAAWRRAHDERPLTVPEFMQNLRAESLVFTPDGGRANRDRVVLRYGLADGSVPGTITVRLPNAPTGAEVDPAPRAGY